MDDRRDSPQPTSAAEDEFTRESLLPAIGPAPPPRLPRLPRQMSRRVVVWALVVALVVAAVGAGIGVTSRLRAADEAERLAHATPTFAPTLTPTQVPPTATPARSPQENGWTLATAASGDLQFAASDPQRGYLCGIHSGQARADRFGVTLDGGTTWSFQPSPTTQENCSLQVSPNDPLAVVVMSTPGSCAAPCPNMDAHYSTDGGLTWRAAPIPAHTLNIGGTAWSGAYLYVWGGTHDDEGGSQPGVLKVSKNGGAFKAIDVQKLLPGARDVSIATLVAGDTRMYANVSYAGCPLSFCRAIVASGDGGATWQRVAPMDNALLVGARGSVLYGMVLDNEGTPQFTTAIVKSTNNGVTWTELKFPPVTQLGLPSQVQPLDLHNADAWTQTPDGTFFATASNYGAVAYLIANTWAVIPFSFPDYYGLRVSLDAHGQPQRVWVLIRQQSSNAGIYWHDLPQNGQAGDGWQTAG